MPQAAHWGQLRELFDAVCELPREQWGPALAARSSDAALIAEVTRLLHAQTDELMRVRAPLERLAEDIARPEVQVGDCLGPWRLTALLAEGGMGAVFSAERADALYRRTVAVKVLPSPMAPALRAHLLAEQQILADLQHPGVARLYDAGETPSGNPYLVMEHVAGLPLDRYLQAHAPPLRQRLALFVQICRIVQFAHAQLVVHCDLKPSNVLVDDQGRPVLLDFGVARLLGQPADESADDGLPRYVTPAYASPELLGGQRVGVASDVFSLGAMLAEISCGQRVLRPLQAEPVAVPLPSALARTARERRALRGPLDAIVARACAMVPEQRYATVEALADDVARYLAFRPVRAGHSGALQQTRLFLRRNWRSSVAAAGVVLVVAGLLVRLDMAGRESARNADIANRTSDFLVASFDVLDPGTRGGAATSELSARELLDQSVRRLHATPTMQPVLRARLQVVLGRAYMNLGQPQQAEPLLQQGAQALAAAGPADLRDAALAYADLATLQDQARQRDAAARSASQAAALLASATAPDALARARVLAVQAQVRSRSAGGSQPAVAMFTQALGMLDDQHTLDARRVRSSLRRQLASVQAATGALLAAEQTLRAAINDDGGADGEGIDYQKDLQLLSQVLFDQGRIDPALQVMERNLELTRHIYGEQSSFTASAESALAGQYLDLGRYESSDRHFRHSLQISAAIDGVDSFAYARKLFAHGIMKEAYGDTAAAEALYRQALDRHQRLLGADQGETLDVEMVLARLLMRVGQLQASDALLQRVGRVWRRQSDPGSPDRQSLRLVEIEWMTRSGNLVAARTALDAFRAQHPSPSSSLALRQTMQEALLAQRSGAADAAERAGEVVREFSRLYGADSVATAKWRIPYAETLTDAGHIAQARAEVKRAQPRLGEIYAGSEFNTRMHTLAQRWTQGTTAVTAPPVGESAAP
ncbi:serine/threonine-protein kinase [Stenotrophomonas sp. ZAC14D2_NAIMI4_6]|uniref:serine/threonine-protein kinase n=1 Tax=Stenotrophomonas sp. ZAC14D2_NAIMI4_6 TaxID=2072406 RepID=UPI000D541BC3|nr:serine/threonine-protein kinase [Stenotrophomonas sp. ZAC14D2_NAIMI4_6]AWH22701.1 hypothetical protein C1933_16500 [Stenotrophomonas sp. ZAC14D2_NAIMI4_6]